MSTLPYTIVFALLVLEMLIFAVLIPLPRHWRSALLKFISNSPTVGRGVHILKILFVFVFLLFADAVNRLQRHQGTTTIETGNMYGHDPRLDASLAAKKFYMQRNMYLTGFTLFLSLILERTYKLVSENIKREEEVIALKSQNSDSLKVHDRRMSEITEAHKSELSKLQKEIERKETDLETLKKQCKQQSEEYFRLADRNNELERRGLPVENRKDK
ncbi:Endoplasmic reticulum transmembrane protein 3 [Umbelopsis nana]